MEREALRKKAKVDDQQATPTTSSVQETPVPLPSRGLTESSKGSIEPNVAMKQTTCDVSHTSQGPPSATGSDILGDGQPPSMEAQMDIPRPSIEVGLQIRCRHRSSLMQSSPQTKTCSIDRRDWLVRLVPNRIKLSKMDQCWSNSKGMGRTQARTISGRQILDQVMGWLVMALCSTAQILDSQTWDLMVPAILVR